MPLYEFQCPMCGMAEDRTVMLADLDKEQKCNDCSAPMERQFPLEAAFGFQPYEAYYDESLGIDIGGRREKKQTLAAMGYEETGDRVKGARNFDKHAPHHVKPLPPRGVTLSDVQRATAQARKDKDEQRLYGEKGTKAYRQRRRMDKSKMVHVNTRVG